MRTLELTVQSDGLRADTFLAQSGAGLTRSAAQKLMEQGAVTANGAPLAKNARLAAGTVVTVCLPEPEPLEAVPQDIPLEIAYEDEDVIVIDKPVGMVVHPAPGHPDGTVVNALLCHCGGSLSGINGVTRPGIVHRIDRDTSGLLIAAKNDAAHQALAAQLEDHSLYREYRGVALGHMKEPAGVIDAPIARHPSDRKKMAVRPDGRRAVTHYEVLEEYPGYSYLKFRLETGRTHQIRVHMAYRGHPLLGDTVYGAPKGYPGLAGQCLHAASLSFLHPRTGERITVESALPDWFRAVLTKLRGMG